MKVLLTGANGYIGRQLLTRLIAEKHEVVCVVRNAKKLQLHKTILKEITVVEVDFSRPFDPEILPSSIDIAYFLIHGMYSGSHFEDNEQAIAQRFRTYVDIANVKQVIYLGRICNSECLPPIHRASLNVETELQKGQYALTVLRAGLIIGEGSYSFEIMRELIKGLPLILTSKWIKSKCEPIATTNVLDYLIGVMHKPAYYNHQYDISGIRTISYESMIHAYAHHIGKPQRIFTIPFFSPQISSYLLRITTATVPALADHLVYSLIDDLIGEKNNLAEELNIDIYDFKEALIKILEGHN